MVSQSKNGFPKYGSHLVVSISWFSIILWFPLNGFSIKKWFPKIWLSIKKWFPKIWFSIILWYSSRGFHLVVLNHHMVSLKFLNRHMVTIKFSQSNNGISNFLGNPLRQHISPRKVNYGFPKKFETTELRTFSIRMKGLSL